METSIIRIGNSEGIIIPKRLISRFSSSKKVNLQLRDGGLFIEPIDDNPRKGWEEEFAKATLGEPDESNILGDIGNEFDQEEWTW